MHGPHTCTVSVQMREVHTHAQAQHMCTAHICIIHKHTRARTHTMVEQLPGQLSAQEQAGMMCKSTCHEVHSLRTGGALSFSSYGDIQTVGPSSSIQKETSANEQRPSLQAGERGGVCREDRHATGLTRHLGTLYLCQLLGFPLREEWLALLQLQWPAFLASCKLLMLSGAAHQPGCWNGKLRSAVTSFGRYKPHTNIHSLTEERWRLPQHFGRVGCVHACCKPPSPHLC